MRILYITYDGLTDPLGTSQILPYLVGLSESGHQITVLSTEKDAAYASQNEQIKSTIRKYNIKWVALKYHAKPKVISTVSDIRALKTKAKELHLQEHFEIVHCRSYVASLVGLWLKRKYPVKFLFDMRGFYANERVDGHIWKLNHPIYALIYKYFKAREREFLNEADHTISLTERAKKDIQTWTGIKNQPIPIEVIPCCVDQELFDPEKVSSEKVGELRRELGISADDFILTYLGSFSTWYLLDEMMQFYAELLKHKKSAKFLFITHDPKQTLIEVAMKYGIGQEKLIVVKASRSEVPALLCLSTVSIFFIMPVYSKTASSPTKLGEVLSMGIPVITNSGVGDVDEILAGTQCGTVIKEFDVANYQKAVLAIDALLQTPKSEMRSLATKYFSLKDGINAFDRVYSKIENLQQ